MQIIIGVALDSERVVQDLLQGATAPWTKIVLREIVPDQICTGVTVWAWRPFLGAGLGLPPRRQPGGCGRS